MTIHRSQMRRMGAEIPLGNPELGYFDPATTVAAFAGGRAQRKANTAAAVLERDRLAELAPYREAGASALPQFQQNIEGQPTFADTVANIESDPAYQFELGQGQRAIEGSAAARGLLRSGRTLKDLATYAQDLAKTRTGEAYNRDLNAFTTKQNQLLTLIQGGQNAAGAPSMLPQLALMRGENSANTANALATSFNKGAENFLRLMGGG